MRLTDQEKYCIDEITKFKEVNGDWPRAQQIPALARMMQRKMGGIVAFRKQHNLGYADYTKGSYRRKVYKTLETERFKTDDTLLAVLSEKYSRVNVHRNYPLYGDSRNRSNFCVFLPNDKTFIVEYLFPKDLYSFKGCLALKYKKFKDYKYSPIIFVNMNPKVSQEEMTASIANKKVPLEPNMSVISFEDFQKSKYIV